jgi:type II secretory pathway pseudopilin PulG
MLIAVAVIGVGLAATSEIWSQSRQREREQELLFVGDQFRQAIALYYQRTPGAAKQYPAKLEDLLQDKRYLNTQRYLRKPYADPMTGKTEWGLVTAPGGGIMGVYSLSNASPIKRGGFRQRDRTFEGATTYHEWRFFYEPALVPQMQKAAAKPAI